MQKDLYKLYCNVVKSKHNRDNKLKYDHIYKYGFGEPVFTCCICNGHTSIIRSISNKGINLICLRCKVKYFASDNAAIRFCCGENITKEGEHHEGR